MRPRPCNRHKSGARAQASSHGARGITCYPRKPHGERQGRKCQGAAAAQAPSQAVQDGLGAVHMSLGHWGPEICCLTAPDTSAHLTHSSHAVCLLRAGACTRVCPAPGVPDRQSPAQGLPPDSPAHSQAGAQGSYMHLAVTMGRRAACSVPPPSPTTAPWTVCAQPCLRAQLCALPSAASLPAKTSKGRGTGHRQPSAMTW